MNPCRDIELELAAYGSGELDPAKRASVRHHLEGCAACRTELARERNLRHTLGSLPVVHAPDDFDSRIMEAIHSSEGRSLAGRNRFRLTAAAALIAACLVLAFMLPTLRPVSDPTQTWTQEEIAAARQDVFYTLALTADVIHRSQRETVVDVFADRLPDAINASFKKVKLTNSGGNG